MTVWSGMGRRLAAGAVCAALLGCASAEPVVYSGLASASRLGPNPRNDSGRVPYSFATQADWRSYSRVIIDPVIVYRGADHQFGDMPEADRAALASYMRTRFAEALRTRFTLAADTAPGTLRVRLTLTGATTTTPVLGTLTRFDIAGGLYNGVQTIRGGEGALTGAVYYAVELFDAPSDRLLAAYVTKQYPGAYNIPASFGALAAARTGIDKGADALLAQLR